MSPIPDDVLDRNKHVLMYDDERVLDALVELRDRQGQDWWHLVVDVEEGGYAITRFGDLSAYIEDNGKAALEQSLGDLVGTELTPVEVIVEQAGSDLDTVRETAFETDSQVVVVTTGGEFRGILPVGGTRSAFENRLLTLAGQYATLPDKGLISRRRMKSKEKKR